MLCRCSEEIADDPVTLADFLNQRGVCELLAVLQITKNMSIRQPVTTTLVGAYCQKTKGGGNTTNVATPWAIVQTEDEIKLSYSRRLEGMCVEFWKRARITGTISDLELEFEKKYLPRKRNKVLAIPIHYKGEWAEQTRTYEGTWGFQDHVGVDMATSGTFSVRRIQNLNEYISKLRGTLPECSLICPDIPQEGLPRNN